MSLHAEDASRVLSPELEARERRIALLLTFVVLATLTIVKPFGGVPYVGTVGFTIAAGLQLYLPLWRAERYGLPYDFVGIHLHAWKQDLRLVIILCLVTFPPYAVAHHLYMTAMHGWSEGLGCSYLTPFFPKRTLAFHWPTTLSSLFAATAWLAEMILTHTLGVALPEETFYRGYLQRRLEAVSPPRLRIAGVAVGRAAVATAALFALGHFLGEWNPMRLGPFFPALVFAWQRNATGSIMGAVTFHAACNVFGQLLFAAYQPV